MLGFVNGRSCAHKSKPRGLVLCFIISSAKVLLFIFALCLSATFCAFSLRFFAIKYFLLFLPITTYKKCTRSKSSAKLLLFFELFLLLLVKFRIGGMYYPSTI